MHPIITTHNWIIGHPVTMIIATFAASGLISLYGNEIKTFIHIWPLRTMRSYNRYNNRTQLALLERVHNNAYELVRYLALSCATVIINTVAWYSFITALNFWTSSQHLQFTQPWPILFGMTVGKALQVSTVMQELGAFESRTDELRTAIANDDAKLALKKSIK